MRQLGYMMFDPLQQLHTSPMACILALAEAGATNSEITMVRGVAVDLTESTVQLPGNTRTDPRTNQLTPWGVDTLRKHFGDHEPNELIVTNAFGQQASSSSISQSFKQLTMFSSLGRHKLSLNSVRAWRAKQIFNQTQHIECAAKFLGVRSLDTAAQMIGWHWRQTP